MFLQDKVGRISVLIPLFGAGLGDCVMILPMIEALKQLSQIKIDLLVSEKSVSQAFFLQYPGINTLLTTSDNLQSYDLFLGHYMGARLFTFFKLIIVLKIKNPSIHFLCHRPQSGLFIGKFRSLLAFFFRICFVDVNYKQHNTQNFLNLVNQLGISVQKEGVIPDISAYALTLTSQHHVHDLRPYVVIHPGTAINDSAKRWPIQYWVTLAELLSERGFHVIIVGSEQEKSFETYFSKLIFSKKISSLIGVTTISELISILFNAEFFVGQDSGVAHLAAATGKTSIVLWGPTSRVMNDICGKNVHVLSRHLPCSPCIPAGGDEREALRRCQNDQACLKGMEPSWVINNIMTIVSEAN